MKSQPEFVREAIVEWLLNFSAPLVENLSTNRSLSEGYKLLRLWYQVVQPNCEGSFHIDRAAMLIECRHSHDKSIDLFITIPVSEERSEVDFGGNDGIGQRQAASTWWDF